MRQSDLGLLIIPSGISGSGKSWLRDNLKEVLQDEIEITVVCPDLIREELFGSVSVQEDGNRVFKIARERVQEALKKGQVVYFDALNLAKAKRRSEAWAREVGAAWINIGLKSSDDPERCFHRISQDLASNVNRAKVPEEVVYDQYERWSKMDKSGMRMASNLKDVKDIAKDILAWYAKD